jgi:lysozyme family protein
MTDAAMEVSSKKTPDFKTLWATCKIDPNRIPEVKRICEKIRSIKEKHYEPITEATGVPWKMIGILHYREASLRLEACLHNGQPWNKVTTWVPKGRGPWKSFAEAGIDAMIYDGLHKVRFDDEVTMLIFAEKYNGLGYRKSGELSPYVWAGTNHHDETGKYVADGKFDPAAPERQLGVAAILKGLEVL